MTEVTGVVCALLAEAGSIERTARRFDTVYPAPYAAMLTFSGVGPAAAEGAARTLLERGVERLMSWGFATGLHPILDPGDVSIPEEIVAEDGLIIPVDSTWRSKVVDACAFRFPVERRPGLAEVTAVLRNRKERTDVLRRTDCAVADMESAAVGRVALEAGVPFLTVRVVIDPAAHRLPYAVTETMTSRGTVPTGRLVRTLVRRPTDWMPFVRLVANYRTALRTLQRLAEEPALWRR